MSLWLDDDSTLDICSQITPFQNVWIETWGQILERHPCTKDSLLAFQCPRALHWMHLRDFGHIHVCYVSGRDESGVLPFPSPVLKCIRRVSRWHHGTHNKDQGRPIQPFDLFLLGHARQTRSVGKLWLMRQYRIVQGCLHSVVLLTIACIGIACIIGRVLRFPHPSSAHPSGAAPPAPYTPLHLKRGRDLVPLLWPSGRPASTAPKLHAVATRCLPASVPTRSRTAGRRDYTRLPRKAVTAVPAPSMPCRRWRQLRRTPVPAVGPSPPGGCRG